jgi:hypothetical protein
MAPFTVTFLDRMNNSTELEIFDLSPSFIYLLFRIRGHSLRYSCRNPINFITYYLIQFYEETGRSPTKIEYEFMFTPLLS